uniref:DDE Tnp4 domain-containing protein n=1 Tax=Magallana gigas TaxID=29159 RepID=A0A8W8M755_MAGGI
MTTESANTSRLVTKIRWVVESANSRIKQWKYLQHVLPTSQIPYIGDFIRIVCAICNRYMKPLSNGNATEDESLGCKMLFLSKQVNALQQHVEEHHLDRRSVCWEPVDDLKGFPYLDEEQLRNLTCGIYQLRLSPSYAQEHLEGNCQIHVHKEEPGLVRSVYAVMFVDND